MLRSLATSVDRAPLIMFLLSEGPPTDVGNEMNFRLVDVDAILNLHEKKNILPVFTIVSPTAMMVKDEHEGNSWR